MTDDPDKTPDNADDPTVPVEPLATPADEEPTVLVPANGLKADETDAEPQPERDPDADAVGDPAGIRPDRPEEAPTAPADKPRKRSAAAGAVIGLLVGLLGFALVVQVRNNATDPSLASARQADLLQILADLESRSQRLQGDISDLEQQQRELASTAQGTKAALDQARQRADELGILAGTLPAEGPGITVTFEARAENIRAIDVLDAVQELRNAGAEAMQISGANGTAARIIVSTYFTDAPNGAINVEGRTLTGPFTITAIGDPSTMAKAMRIPGGVVALVTGHGGNVIVGEPGTVKVTALHEPATLEYAKPVS